MLRKLLLIFTFLVAGTALLTAQTGSVKIKLVDAKTHEPLPFASVLVEQGGVKVVANQTNFDGEVLFTSLGPGKYDIKATFIGFQPMQLTGVIVSVDKITYKQFDLQTGEGHQLDVVDVVVSKVDLIDADVKSGTTFTRDQYMQLAQKDVNSIVATAAGVYQADQKSALSIRGSRGEGTAYYVDGVRTPTATRR